VRELAPDVTTAKSGRTDTSLSVLLSEETSLTATRPLTGGLYSAIVQATTPRSDDAAPST